MHSFRIRYIVLGLLVYIQSAFCRTCGTSFDDVPSSTWLASVVFEGTANQVVPILASDQTTAGTDSSNSNLLYNLVFFKVRRVLKGDLPRRQGQEDRWAQVLVGKFGKGGGGEGEIEGVDYFGERENREKCLAPLVEVGSQYVVFLNSSERTSGVSTPIWQRNTRQPWTSPVPLHYPISAFPVPSSKTILREVRDWSCGPRDCKSAKLPTASFSKTQSQVKVTEGSRLQLQCKVRGKPAPQVRWYRTGVLLPPGGDDRAIITPNKKGSRLRIRKTKQEDGGQYSCQAVSVMGPSPLVYARVMVLPANSSNRHHVLCERQTYCLNGGICYQMVSLGQIYCECKDPFTGTRCAEKKPDPSVTELIKIGGSVRTVMGVTVAKTTTLSTSSKN